jgi:hypothetical protein
MSRPNFHLRGERHPRSKLTAAKVHAIRASRDTQRRLADRYGVSVSTIFMIKTGRSWSWLRLDRPRLARRGV